MLRQQWAVNFSDPRALRLWLMERGVKIELLSPDEVSREKKQFEEYHSKMYQVTGDLTKGILAGPNLGLFFSGVQTFPTHLKEAVFREALSTCSDERLVVLLSVLSRENREVIQSALDAATASPIVMNFNRYLRTRGQGFLVTGAQAREFTAAATSSLEQLFQIISLFPKEMNDQISRIPNAQKNELVKCAERILDLAPKDGYGGFLRYQLAVFVCIADPENPTGDQIIELLIYGNPANIDTLPLVGERRVEKVLVELIARGSSEQTELLAATFDVVRSQHPASLSAVPEGRLHEFLKAKNVPLALSAHAAAVEIGSVPKATFVQFFEKRASSDKRGLCILWLARNPEYLDYVRIDQCPPQAWNSALTKLARCEPLTAIRLLDKAFAHPSSRTEPAVWSGVFKTLDRVGSESSDSLFTTLALTLLRQNPDSASTILSREPALSLLWRNIWNVCGRSQDEKLWNLIFDLVASKISEQSVLQWLHESTIKTVEIREWLQSVLIPQLLTRQILSSDFLSQMQDIPLQHSLARHLCSQAVRDLRNLQGLAREWPDAREGAKNTVTLPVIAGLRIAMRAAKGDSTLSIKLREISDAVQSWYTSDLPPIDPSLMATTTIELPEVSNPSEQSLSKFFSAPVKNAHAVALFFGNNPWAVDLYFSARLSSWPNPKLLLGQITKTFSYLAGLRSQSDALKNRLNETVRIDLAIVLRDGLAEIEETIAGYFALRNILSDLGLKEVDSRLGAVVSQEDLSSERHKVIRDQAARGKQRLFGLGLKVGERVIGSALVMKSGEDDDRD